MRKPPQPRLKVSVKVPPTDIGAGYPDGGIVDNLPLLLAVEEGCPGVLGIDPMAGAELDRLPATWIELMGRTIQLGVHQRILSDFDRVRRRARVVVLCPVLGQGDGMDLNLGRGENLIERAAAAHPGAAAGQEPAPVSGVGVHYMQLAAQVAR